MPPTGLLRSGSEEPELLHLSGVIGSREVAGRWVDFGCCPLLLDHAGGNAPLHPSRAPCDIGAGRRAGAHPGDHDPPQGVVGLPVAAGVEAVAGDLPGGGGDRCDRAQVRPGGLGAEPFRVIPGGGQEQRGGVRADAVEGEQAGGAGSDEGGRSARPGARAGCRGTRRAGPARAPRPGWHSRRRRRGGAAAPPAQRPGPQCHAGKTGPAGQPGRRRPIRRSGRDPVLRTLRPHRPKTTEAGPEAGKQGQKHYPHPPCRLHAQIAEPLGIGPEAPVAQFCASSGLASEPHSEGGLVGRVGFPQHASW